MLVSRAMRSVGLLITPSQPIFIYLRDHNRLITPENTKLKLSYLHPRSLIPDMPTQERIEFQLAPEKQEQMDREIFEEYKKKILRGTIDEEEEVGLYQCRQRLMRFGDKKNPRCTTTRRWTRSTSWRFLTPNEDPSSPSQKTSTPLSSRPASPGKSPQK